MEAAKIPDTTTPHMNGGRIIAQGEPAELVASLTAHQSLHVQFANDRFRDSHAARVGAIPGVASHVWDARTDTLSIQTTDVAGTLSIILGGVTVFAVVASVLALVTRIWALAWIALAGSAIASVFGMLSIWSRQTRSSTFAR